MRILHLIYDHAGNPWIGGGGSIRALEIYRRLAGRHDITMVCGKYPGARDYREGSLDVRFVGSGRNHYPWSILFYIWGAIGFLRAHRNSFDVMVEDFSPAWPLFSFLWFKRGILQIHQMEGLHHLKKHSFLGIPLILLEAIYPKMWKETIAISEVCRKRLGPRGRVNIITNGVSPDLVRLESKEENYILFLGRLDLYQKGLDTLKKALPFLGKGVTVLIAGSGKDRRKIEKLFEVPLRDGSVQMVGHIAGEPKNNVLRSCKYVVIPSRFEGQPIVLLESAAAGKPVVVSDLPELRFAVEAGFGISFRTGVASELAEKMILLLEDESRRKRMGEAGKEYARQLTWDRIAEEYEMVLVRVGNKGIGKG